MNNIFNMFNSFNVFGGVVKKIYKPYINYTWQTVYQPPITDGVELVVNGGFSDGTIGWNELGSVISNGVATFNLEPYTYSLKTSYTISTDTYIIAFDIVDYVSGSLKLYLGAEIGITEHNGSGWSGNGRYSILYTSSSSSTLQARAGLNGFVGSIDNISIQKVTSDAGMYVQNNGKSGTNLQLYSGNPLDFQGSQYIDINNIVADTLTGFSISVCTTAKGYYIGSADNQNLLDTVNNNKIRLRVQSEIIEIPYLHSFDGTLKTINVNVYNNIVTFYADNIFIGQGTFASQKQLSLNIIGKNYTNFDGQLDYLTISDRVLTAEEIALSNSNPNAFYDSMVNDANTLFATDFRGTAGYIADDKNKVVGSELVVNGTFDTDLSGWTVSGEDATHTITHTANGVRFQLGTTNVITVLSQNSLLSETSYYVMSYDVTDYVSGRLKMDVDNASILLATSIGSHNIIFKESSPQLTIYRSSADVDITLDNISVKELSAVYPITNYSATMRTNFQQETTGLQDLTRSFDSLGFYTGVTDYLNCNGVGYGDTFYYPSDIDTTYEAIVYIDTTETSNKVFGGYSANRLYIGTSANGRAYGRYGNLNSTKLVTDGYHYITIVSDKTNNLTKLFIDGVLYSSEVYAFLDNSGKVYLGDISPTPIYRMNKPIKLFNIHQSKVLTQEEITTNYNDYVARGLLNG